MIFGLSGARNCRGRVVEHRPKILIVEDNRLDAELTQWALAEAGYSGSASVVSDGLDALALLRRESPHENSPIPDLVILDLNLRVVDGPEVLRMIRETPELNGITVAIFSSNPDELMRAQAAKADCYLAKPNSLDGYAATGKALLHCYFEARHATRNAEHSPIGSRSGTEPSSPDIRAANC